MTLVRIEIVTGVPDCSVAGTTTIAACPNAEESVPHEAACGAGKQDVQAVSVVAQVLDGAEENIGPLDELWFVAVVPALATSAALCLALAVARGVKGARWIQLAAMLPPQANSLDLSKRVLEYTLTQQQELNQIVLEAIQHEAKENLKVAE